MFVRFSLELFVLELLVGLSCVLQLQLGRARTRPGPSEREQVTTSS